MTWDTVPDRGQVAACRLTRVGRAGMRPLFASERDSRPLEGFAADRGSESAASWWSRSSGFDGHLARTAQVERRRAIREARQALPIESHRSEGVGTGTPVAGPLNHSRSRPFLSNIHARDAKPLSFGAIPLRGDRTKDAQ